MKQNITIEQLNELSDNARMRLRKWFAPEEGWIEREDAVLCVHKGETAWSVDGEANNHLWWQKAFPLPSIGQMIEFLVDSGQFTSCINGELEYDFVGPLSRGKIRIELAWNGELCDALWETVKEVLNAR